MSIDISDTAYILALAEDLSRYADAAPSVLCGSMVCDLVTAAEALRKFVKELRQEAPTEEA